MVNPMHRTPPVQPLPHDEAFTPGPDPGPNAHPPEDDFWQNVMFESNDYKIEHYRACAQLLANTWNSAVLLHYYALPHFQRTNPTMMAAFIPADEVGLLTPPPPPTRTADDEDEQPVHKARSKSHRR